MISYSDNNTFYYKVVAKVLMKYKIIKNFENNLRSMKNIIQYLMEKLNLS